MKKNLNKILILFFATLTIGFSQNNYSLSFDGVDDYVLVGHNENLNLITEEFSFLTTVKFLTDNPKGYILSKRYYAAGQGYEIRVANNTLYAEINPGGGAITLTAPIESDNSFHTFLVTFKNQNYFRLYMDGVLVDDFGVNAAIGTQTDFSASSVSNNENLVIGDFSAMDGRVFNGLIHKLSIANTSLSIDQVEVLFQDIDYNLSENLVADWNFNEGSGSTLTDLSGNGNNGTISGATWSDDVPILPTPPVIGGNNSFSFDGDDDRVELPNQITEGLTSVTFMAWFNTTDHSGYSNIVQDDGPSGALYIRYNPDGSFKYVFKASQGWRSISISPPSYGVWHHVAMSWDGTNIKAYLDGEEVGSSSGSGIMSGGGPIYIGNWQQQEGFSGKIDDVQYWNIALSESEIQTHMNTEPTGNEEGLIGYWNFNESEGSELIDLSGNGNNGTVYGATWSGDGAPVEAPVLGCTDIYAENYDSDANSDDGSCSGYPDNGDFSLEFDGEDDFVGIPLSPSLNLNQFDTLSIAVSFKINRLLENNYEMGLISFGGDMSELGDNGISIAIGGNGGNQLYAWFPGYTIGGRIGSLSSDIWYNVIATFTTGETGSKKIYLNGELQVDEFYDYPFYPNQNNSAYLGIGDLYNGFEGRYFEGLVGNVTVFSRELRQSELNYSMFDDDGVMGSWNFNEGVNNLLYDNSGNANHGSINGATWSGDVPAPPVFGCTDSYAENYNSEANTDDGSCSGYLEDGSYSLDFDGQDDYLSIPDGDHLNIEDDYTWAISGKMNDINQSQNLFSNNTYYNSDGYYVNYLGSDKKVWFSLCSNGTCYQYSSIANQITEDEWFNLAITKNNGLIQIYIDGQNVTGGSWNLSFEDDITQYYVDPDAELRIGIDGNDVQPFFGNLDEILLIKDALNAEEISNYVSSGTINSDLDIVGNWKLNESGGNIAFDFSGKGNHASLNGPSRSEEVPILGCTDPYAENYDSGANSDDGSCSGYPDEENNSLFFSNNNVSVESIGDYSSKVTIMAWIKKDGSDSYSDIISGGCGNLLFTEHQNRLLFGSQCGDPISHDTYSTTEITDNIWHHVAATYNANGGSNNLKVYVDGQLEGQSTKTAYFNVDDFKIGTNNNGDGEFFNGYMDMMRIWNIDLTQEEIQENMNSIEPTINSGLLSDWRFNSGNGNMAFDHSGNANHGIINGPNWSEDIPEMPLPSIEGFTAVGRFNENAYYISNTGGNYFDGVQLSDELGGHLVTISSQEENEFVIQKLMEFSGGSNHLWIGLDDLDGDGSFSWVTGEPLSYEIWSNEQANGLAVEMQTPSGTWRPTDQNDNQEYRRYMVEIESEPLILGCTDSHALNYDSEANINDRFCNGYPENGEYSLSFSESQNHVDLGNNMDSDNEFSIATWVYIDENIIPLNGQRTFINKVNSSNGNKSIFLGSYQSKIGFTVLTGQQSNIMYGSDNQNGSLALTQTPLVPGWQHIGAVFTGDSMLVYINGELDANVVVFQNPGSVNDYDNSVWHMADVLGGSGNVGGKISSMSLWSKPLQQYDIQNLMSESPDPLSAGLMGMWKFAEGEGSLLHDHSGNGNHGTITGATWSDDVPYVGPEWFVSISGNDSNIGSQDEPFATIQHGINAAHNSHIVLVSPGTYTENINFNGRNILVVSEMGPSETIIDGGQNGSVVTFNSGETDGAALDGFTITNGLTENGNGGGIFIDNSSPSIFNVIVENNHANSGGGIDLKGETQTVISNSIVRDNSAEWGAGIYCHSNSPTIENVVVSGNHATVNAGGVYAREYASPIIINCTIVNNSTDGQGGGILTWFNSTVDVKNSIIRDNYPNELGHVSGGSVTLNYSNISGNHEGFSGSNNINADPMFCNQSNNDFRIAQDSPCFGAGESGIDIGAMFDGDYCEESFVNNSLTFNGVDDYVQINNDYDFIDSLSILFWVKPFEQDLNGGQITILQRSNAFGFRYTQNSENNFILDYVINGILPYNWNSTGITLNKDEWNFISFIVDNNSIKVYHNNQIEYELDGISGEITETAWPYIQVGNEAGESLYGSFDEFSIWDISLSSEMIKEAYQSSFSGNEEGLVGYWNFNGGEGSTLIDLSGNGNDGIINGASWDNYGAPIGPTGGENNEPNINGRLSGIISASSDNALLEGAHIIAISEDNSFSAEAYSDINGEYSLDLVGSLNYFVNISYEGLVDHNEYLYVAPFEETNLNASLNVLEDAVVEGTVTDWYTNTPLASASVLLAYTDEEMETIESMTDENGYFMVQVPGEKDYDLFVYADGYWVEHDAFFLSSGSQEEINVGIAEMSSASRLYGTIKDIETNELIPYAEIQLNCDQASDWDHTGALGTYRLFNYYSGDCDDGVLIVSANGYETSVQSASNIAFEAGSSHEMDITLMQGDDPDPGMISGTVFSNIDQSTIGSATINAYNVNTTQLFSIETSEEGSYQLFLPESEYYISITANNHEEHFDTLSVVSGQSFTRDFYLDEVYLNTVSGIVAGPNGNGLFDIEVFVSPEGERYTIASAFTNESGEYTLQVPNGRYDFGAGNTNYYMTFEYSVELSGSDQNIDFTLTPVAQFDGGFAGLVHLNEGDNATVWLNIWNSDLTYQAYISSDENGAYTLPLINGTYSLYAWVPGSNYQSVYVPNAFTIEDNVINYDIYFVAPDAPEPPTIVFLEDVPNDQGGQLELAWTPGDPREYEIFPQYSIWRMDEEWNLISTVPYRGSDVYSMVVPTLGDSTQEGIFESTFMVTAHTINQNIFFDSDPVTSYSIDNIFPGIPQQLVASFSGEVVDLDWVHSEAEDLSHYNLYRQNVIAGGSATIISTETNFYSDNVNQSGEFEYWVTAVDVSGNESDPSNAAMVTLGVEEEMIPMEFALLQNYPNPFNPSTQIMYTLPNTSAVEIVIYDMLGSKVRTLFSGSQDAGYKNVLWNATNEKGDPVSAGMYIYTIEANGFFASKKMILLK